MSRIREQGDPWMQTRLPMRLSSTWMPRRERKKSARPERKKKKRIANLPKNSEEAVGIKYPWATKVEKVLDGHDGYAYFNVYCGGKYIMLCQRDNGYAEWKRDFDKSYQQLTDRQVKYYLTGKEK